MIGSPFLGHDPNLKMNGSLFMGHDLNLKIIGSPVLSHDPNLKMIGSPFWVMIHDRVCDPSHFIYYFSAFKN